MLVQLAGGLLRDFPSRLYPPCSGKAALLLSTHSTDGYVDVRWIMNSSPGLSVCTARLHSLQQWGPNLLRDGTT